jgi:hypothetical protein
VKRLLLEDFTDIDDNKLTWNNKWLGLFESPWGIIEKIKYANLISSKEFMQLCGTDYVRGIKSNIGKKHRDLFTFNGIEDSRFTFYFGFSIKDYTKNLIDLLCRPLFDVHSNFSEYFHDKLYVCPSCIKGGFHSIFHQFKIIGTCPFHNEKLVEVCNKCNSIHFNSIGYEISNSTTLPFHCDCGNYLLENDNNFFPDWYRPQQKDISSIQVKHWLTLSKNEIELLQRTYVLKSKDLPIQTNLMETLLKLGSGKLEVNRVSSSSLTLIKNNIDIEKLITQTHRNRYNQKLINEIFLSTRKTISAISRKIRKEVYLHHRSCLKRIKNHLRLSKDDTKHFCPVAYAYLQCRKNVQGFKEITSVDKNSYFEDRENGGSFDIATNTDRQLIFSMIRDIVNSGKFSSDICKLVWVIQRIIGQLFINHFSNLLNYSVNENNENDWNTLDERIYKNLNFIFINYSKLENTYEIQWGGDFNIKESIKKYSCFCPYKSVKQRRIRPNEISFDPLRLTLEKIHAKAKDRNCL